MPPIFSNDTSFWLTLAATLLLLAPIIDYLWRGWASKRRLILANMSDDAIRAYYALFFRGEAHGGLELQGKYKERYHVEFGLRHYVLPLIVFLFVCFALFRWTIASALLLLQEPTPPEPSFSPLPSIAMAAVSGAYLWVGWELLSRGRRSDLAPMDLLLMALRLVIVTPLAFALTALFTDVAGVPLAFMLGAFPMIEIMTFLRRTAGQRLGLPDRNTEASAELTKIQGVSTPIAERFVAEGVETILQLAYCDPIDLTIRSSYSFSCVTDCASQALAWIYLEEKLVSMRDHAMRGAFEIKVLIDELGGEEEDDRKAARQTLNALARTLKIVPAVLERTFREIADDPYTLFNYEVWFYEPPGQENGDEQEPS